MNLHFYPSLKAVSMVSNPGGPAETLWEVSLLYESGWHRGFGPTPQIAIDSAKLTPLPRAADPFNDDLLGSIVL